MTNVFRHDEVMLHHDAKKEDFETFMREELIPLFSNVFKGPTRTSNADLQNQSLLRDADGHKYLWITAWDGSPESVRGSSFENTRKIRIEGMQETDAMLKKLDSFGTRATEKVFSEVEHTEVPVNT